MKQFMNNSCCYGSCSQEVPVDGFHIPVPIMDEKLIPSPVRYQDTGCYRYQFLLDQSVASDGSHLGSIKSPPNKPSGSTSCDVIKK